MPGTATSALPMLSLMDAATLIYVLLSWLTLQPISEVARDNVCTFDTRCRGRLDVATLGWPGSAWQVLPHSCRRPPPRCWPAGWLSWEPGELGSGSPPLTAPCPGAGMLVQEAVTL